MVFSICLMGGAFIAFYVYPRATKSFKDATQKPVDRRFSGPVPITGVEGQTHTARLHDNQLGI